jgi:hypothetical protein
VASEYSLEELLVWARMLAGKLKRAKARPGIPVLDLQWLQLRCHDTIRAGRRGCDASAQQLLRDVDEFIEEFPGIIAAQDARPIKGALPAV